MMVWLLVRLDAQLHQDSGLTTYPEYHVMSQISMISDRTVRFSGLATVSSMALSHLSWVVSRLEKAGRVQPHPGPRRRPARLGSVTGVWSYSWRSSLRLCNLGAAR